MINTSNSIIKLLSSSKDNHLPLPAINIKGETTVDGLVGTAELIAAHMEEIPPAILQLIQSIIKARTAHFDEFQRLASSHPDVYIQRRNSSHKYFINTLRKVFGLLGGNEWLQRRTTAAGPSSEEDNCDNIEDIEDVLFSNRFSVLDLSSGQAGSDEESEAESGFVTPCNEKKNRRAQGQKAKRLRAKKKGKKSSSASDGASASVPLENYRFLESEEELETEYCIAAWALRSEWTEARDVIQTMWMEVSIEGMNCAIAASVCNVAVAKLKRTTMEIFIDFPDKESYESAIRSLANGDLDTCENLLGCHDSASDPENRVPVDVKEQLLYYAYEALVDFVTDFQKNRNGKPTKAMQSSLNTWDPELDLEATTLQQRIKWRRDFAINWLYDLINVYLSAFIYSSKPKGQQRIRSLDQIDFSATRDPASCRRLFGLNDFVSFLTSLVTQKPGSNFRSRILPHHVFHMQCIIDATAVTRGWSVTLNGSHVLAPPGDAPGAVEDINQFLGEDKNSVSFRSSAVVLQAELHYQSQAQRDSKVYTDHSRVIGLLTAYLDEHLGSSDLDRARADIPPSRFSPANSNGLWCYSPFLCGVGLAESLQLVYAATMSIWDTMPEIAIIAHLHNMLKTKEYLTQKGGAIQLVAVVFEDILFADHKAPKSDFFSAFRTWRETRGRGCFSPRSSTRTTNKSPTIPSVSEVSKNRTFNNESYLILHREVDWNPCFIPDSKLDPWTALAMTRIGHARRDSAQTGTEVSTSKEPELVRRARTSGFDDDLLQVTAEILEHAEWRAHCRSARSNSHEPRAARGGTKDIQKLLGPEYLAAAEVDFGSDITGPRVVSGINLWYLTAQVLKTFVTIEMTMSRKDDPLYDRAYGSRHGPIKKLGVTEKRAAFAELLLAGRHEDSLRSVAKVLDDMPRDTLHLVYWKNVESPKVLTDRAARALGGGKPGDGTPCGDCGPM